MLNEKPFHIDGSGHASQLVLMSKTMNLVTIHSERGSAAAGLELRGPRQNRPLAGRPAHDRERPDGFGGADARGFA
jgi:hypothetical protein